MRKNFDEAAYLQRRTANEAKLTKAGVYGPQMEHDACGVGFVAAQDGKPCRAVVESAIEALQAIWHRGAVDADGMTGDGAGIHIEIPRDFFIEHIARTGHDDDGGRLAVGMVFLPRTDLGAQERCRCIVEQEILAVGHSIYGWRQVPVDISVIGEKGNASRPEIEQIMISSPPEHDESDFERDLYVIRRRIEKAVLAEHINDFYICSLSCRSIIYKGMFLAEQVTSFYPDLMDERFISNFAIYHQRYSTNTFPTWQLAQPFRVLGRLSGSGGRRRLRRRRALRGLRHDDVVRDVARRLDDPGAEVLDRLRSQHTDVDAGHPRDDPLHGPPAVVAVRAPADQHGQRSLPLGEAREVVDDRLSHRVIFEALSGVVALHPALTQHAAVSGHHLLERGPVAVLGRRRRPREVLIPEHRLHALLRRLGRKRPRRVGGEHHQLVVLGELDHRPVIAGVAGPRPRLRLELVFIDEPVEVFEQHRLHVALKHLHRDDHVGAAAVDRVQQRVVRPVHARRLVQLAEGDEVRLREGRRDRVDRGYLVGPGDHDATARGRAGAEQGEEGEGEGRTHRHI